MKQVELVRAYLISKNKSLLVSFRSWLSCVPGNEEEIEMLAPGLTESILAHIVECWMRELGVTNQIKAGDPASRVRRAMKKAG